MLYSFHAGTKIKANLKIILNNFLSSSCYKGLLFQAVLKRKEKTQVRIESALHILHGLFITASTKDKRMD